MSKWLLVIFALAAFLGCVSQDVCGIYGCFKANPPPPTCDYQTWLMKQQCSKDADCVVRVNNYDRTKPCNKDSQCCLAWEKAVETGPPGHTEYPDSDKVVPYCDNGRCNLRFDCSNCQELKAEYLGWRCQNYTGGTANWVCALYNECNC